MMATPGGRLLVLDGLSPAGKIRKVVDLPPGSYWRPDVSFDGKRVLFCYKGAEEEAFHLYEAESGRLRAAAAHGRSVRRSRPDLLAGRRHRIRLDAVARRSCVACRTRTSTRCAAWTATARTIRLISHNNEPDWTPSLLDDGRILYSRWEYTDKALWRIQSLWTVRPDGTQHAAFYGNQSVWPDHLGEARPIPGSHDRVLFTGLAHHNYFAGSLGTIDPAQGSNYPAGLRQITSEIAWPECGRGPQRRANCACPTTNTAAARANYKSPFPLSADWFLVSINTGPFNLYLMDVRGNKELIYRGQHNAWYGLPVRPRPRPPALPSLVAWPTENRGPQKPGVLFSSATCTRAPAFPGAWSSTSACFKAEYHTFTTWDRDFRFEGPAISAVEADNVKRILGNGAGGRGRLVPDSSAFRHRGAFATSGRTSAGVANDAFVHRRDARRSARLRGLPRRSGPALDVRRDVLALRRRPSVLTPPPWGDGVDSASSGWCNRCSIAIAYAATMERRSSAAAEPAVADRARASLGPRSECKTVFRALPVPHP